MSIRRRRAWWGPLLIAGLSLTLLGQSPAESEAICNYLINVSLDPEKKTIEGDLKVQWINRTDYASSEIYLHLYLNAFQNDRSTFARELGVPLWQTPGPIPDDYWGSIEVTSIETIEIGPARTRKILEQEFVQPDDGNLDDQTLMRLRLDEPVAPQETIVLEIAFRSKLPRGIARTGWVKDYFFAAQWFPKIAVFRNGQWNARQYHAFTEYFSDFGDYDVQLLTPAGYVVAGTGAYGQVTNQDGTLTHRFQQEQVHDFAWVASRDLRVRSFRTVHRDLPTVQVKLLLQPENMHLGDRYLAAVRQGLRYFGEWFGPYPYGTLTVLDPPHNSATGGMEYPTFITGGTQFLAPEEDRSLEAVTVHEVGHQWWYGVVATNEFQEAWLDEGITSWAETRLMTEAYPPASYIETFFGFPVVFDVMKIPYQSINRHPLRRSGKLDRMTRTSWQSLNGESYSANSYWKPDLVLATLERLLGEETMLRAMRTYFERYRFAHPTTTQFKDVISEVAGRDMNWFFDQTFESSELLDYAIDSASTEEELPSVESSDRQQQAGAYRSEVVVRRLEGVQLPVEIELFFDDGSTMIRHWDGKERWHKLVVKHSAPLQRATVDPQRKLVLDVNPVNNSYHLDRGEGRSLASVKWSSKWLFWVQNLLETLAFIG